jgi:lysozyme
MQYQWYLQADDNRRSVFLDVAFNAGVHGLLGFASMLHYAEAEDWRNAAAQLLDSDAARRRPDRYRPLANILDPLDAPTPMEA